MKKLTKNKKKAQEHLEEGKKYPLNEAAKLIKKVTFCNFDATVELAIRLGVDPRKANQMVRGSITLPHGLGKEKRVLVLCNPDKEDEAKAAGADHIGLDDYLEKIQQGWADVDVIITTPNVMPKLGKYGKILGPRGLMPNPKTGTVTDDIASAVKEEKAGKVDFRVDKYGIVHAPVGRVSFDDDKIYDNARDLIQAIVRNKPSGAKGTYLNSISISSTMSPGISIDIKSIPGI